jgi:hypothetical protein
LLINSRTINHASLAAAATTASVAFNATIVEDEEDYD